MNNYYLMFLSVNLCAAEHARPDFERPALITESAKGNVTHVRDMLNNGVEVNAKDDKGDTALMAVLKSYKNTSSKLGRYREQLEAVFTLLLENGASLDSVNDIGETPRALIRKHPINLWPFRKYSKK